MFYDVDFVYFQLNLEIYGSQKALKFQLFFVTLWNFLLAIKKIDF